MIYHLNWTKYNKKDSRMNFYKEPLLHYNNLSSINPFPQIEGRYMSGPKLTPKITHPHINNQQHHTSTQTFSIQKAKQRINYQLKLAQQQNRIFEKYQSQPIARIICKKEAEDKPIKYEKRIHTMEIDNLFRVEKVKSKRMHSFMNQKRIITMPHNQSPTQNSKNLNILKILIRKKNRRSMDQDHIFCRSIDSHQKHFNIKINKEPKQFYNFTTSKSFILMEDIEKEKISLNKPQIIRNNNINQSYMTERKLFFRHKKQDPTQNITNPLNVNQNQRIKKNSVDLIDDLDALSDQKQQYQDKQICNDKIERWK